MPPKKKTIKEKITSQGQSKLIFISLQMILLHRGKTITHRRKYLQITYPTKHLYLVYIKKNTLIQYFKRKYIQWEKEKNIWNISSQKKIHRWKITTILLIINDNSLLTTQFSSITQSHPTLWDPMDCSTLDFRIHHQLLELIQTHVYWISDAIQQSYSLLSLSSSFTLSQLEGLFQWVSSSNQVVKVLEFQLLHQSFQWKFRTDFL